MKHLKNIIEFITIFLVVLTIFLAVLTAVRILFLEYRFRNEQKEYPNQVETVVIRETEEPKEEVIIKPKIKTVMPIKEEVKEVEEVKEPEVKDEERSPELDLVVSSDNNFDFGNRKGF